MKAFIIEDEKMAQDALARTLTELFPDITVEGSAMSVADAVAWLGNPSNRPDIIFMDVELSDGKCFEIFRKIDITAPVIMTTAYDNYAVKAFEVNSVDYLLKPIEPSALKRAVERCKARAGVPVFKENILVKFGDHMIPVSTSEIYCVYSEDKSNHIVTRKGEQYMVDDTMDSLSAMLGSKDFFKISRSCIVSRKAVGGITKLLGSRLRLTLSGPGTLQNLRPEVSRSHSDDFLKWIDK